MSLASTIQGPGHRFEAVVHVGGISLARECVHALEPEYTKKPAMQGKLGYVVPGRFL